MPRCHPPWCSSPALDDDAPWTRPPQQALSSKLSLGEPPFFLPVQVAYRQSKAKTDVVDPEATPKTGVLARVRGSAGCIATCLGDLVLPPHTSYLSYHTPSTLLGYPNPSLDSLEAVIEVLQGLPLQETAYILTDHDG